MKLFTILTLLLISLFEFLPIGNIEILSSFLGKFPPFYLTLFSLIACLLLYIITKNHSILLLITFNILVIIFKNDIRFACTKYVYKNNKNKNSNKSIFVGLELKKNDPDISIFAWHCLPNEQFTLVHKANHKISDSNEGIERITILDSNWYINRIPFLNN